MGSGFGGGAVNTIIVIIAMAGSAIGGFVLGVILGNIGNDDNFRY